MYMAAASGLREAHRTRGAHWTSRASWSVIQALESSVKLEAQDASKRFELIEIRLKLPDL